MQPAEMIWRASQLASLPLDHIRRARAAVPGKKGPDEFWWRNDNYPITHHQSGGEYTMTRIFDLEFSPEFDFDWHCDYRHGKVVPRKFARTLDIRDAAVVGDIKYIWEISRHQHLSAIVFSNRSDAAQIAVEALRSWLDNNPYLLGVNWTSSLELALRLMSWALLYPAVRSRLSEDHALRESFADSIYLHLSTIRGHMSLYSSANNHLIGEMVGLYVGAVCFPWWSDCERWRTFAKDTLEREILLQFTPEGINREQAMAYQLFTLEMLLLAMLVGRNSGDEFSRPFADRIRAALDYVASVATPTGDLPWFGDSDGARGFLVSQGETAFQVIMQLGGLLFDAPQLAQFAPKVTAAALALMPRECAKLGHKSPVYQPPAPTRLFKEGGVMVTGNEDWKLVMDVGPLGYTGIAAHGHADALSVQLAGGDHYLIVDAGTYAYHSHPEWRTYFRGTAAHNTAQVDKIDQSTMAGRFLWSSKASTRVTEFSEKGDTVRITAEQDGYLRLPDPVLHRRTVTFDKGKPTILVEDEFCCKESHDIDIHWHLSERVDVSELSDGSLLGQTEDRSMVFSFSGDPFEVRVVRGSESPILGWRSLEFNCKHPVSTIRCSLKASGTTTFVTKIALTQSIDNTKLGEYKA